MNDVISTSKFAVVVVALASCSLLASCKKGKKESEGGTEKSTHKDETCPEGTAEKTELVDGDTHIYCAKPDGTKHGPYKTSDDLGSSTIGTYKDGNRDGTWTFQDDGEVMFTTDYSAACGEECESGLRVFYEGGKKVMAKGLVDGEQEGWSFAYKEDETIAKAACFESGRQTMVLAEPSKIDSTPCPLQVRATEQSGRVLVPFREVDEDGSASMAFVAGEVLKSDAAVTLVKTDAGRDIEVRSAFVVSLSVPVALKEGMQVLAYHPDAGGLIGTVTDVDTETVTVYRFKGFGYGIMNSEFEVPIGDVRVIDAELAAGSGVLLKTSKPRMGTVFATHGDKVAAEVDGSLVILGPGGYHALAINPELGDDEAVYVGPMLGIEQGVVVGTDSSMASATVEYEFAGRTRDGEFMVSRILPVKALEAE